MTSNELLSEIKKAEEDAKKSVKEALNNKTWLISEAHKKARQIIDDGESEALKATQESLKLGEAKLKMQRDKIISKGVSQSESLVVNSKSNISKAVKYLVEEFEMEIRL